MVGDWAQTVVDLFQARPTYQTLADKGIVPGGSYTKEQIHAALQPIHGGMTPAIACRNGDQWTEIYYYYYLTGNVVNGKYTPVEASKFSFLFFIFVLLNLIANGLCYFNY